MQKHAAIYLRISRDKDGREEAPDRQRTAIQAYLKTQGWTTSPVLEYLDVSKSASVYAKKNRTAYDRMVADIDTGKFEVVVVWDTDRLTRRPREIEDWIDWTKAGRVQLASVNENIDTSTAAGQLYLRIKGDFAAHESDHKSTRIKAKNAQTAGKAMPHAGRIPFGWESDRITPKPSESTWVKFAVESVGAGKSLYSIARVLNAEGVKRHGGTTWTATRVAELVRRPANAGILMHKGEQMKESRIQPLVSIEDWKLAVTVLDQNINSAPGRKPSNNWLSNLMLCGVCGSRMVSNSVSSRGQRAWFYMCETKAHRNKVSDDRRHVAMRADLAHDAMQGWLFTYFTTRIIEPPAEPETATVFKIAEVQADIDAATDALMTRGANKTRIAARLAELDSELAKLSRQRASELAASQDGSALDEFWRTFNYAKPEDRAGFDAVWADVPTERKRQIVAGTFAVVIRPGRDTARRFDAVDLSLLGDADPLTFALLAA